MGSPITLSGFNDIDFNLVLEAIMTQERVPLDSLESRRTTLQSQDSEYANLATKLASVELAAESLDDVDAFSSRTVTNTGKDAVTVSSTNATPIGTYDIVVNELARAQVTGSTSTHADADTEIVASGGSITVDGVTVNLSVPVTLQELADAINSTNDITVTATAVANGASSYQLVLTGNSTGAANGFTLANGLTGGSGVTFSDFDSDGTTGDSVEDNAVQATDASATVNNITVSSATNTIDGAIPGATLTLLKKDPAVTNTATVSRDDEALRTLVDDFVTAYNDLTQYLDQQFQDSGNGESGAIGRDGLLRGLRTSLRSSLSSSFATGGAYSYLAEIGLGSDRNGQLILDDTAFNKALSDGFSDVQTLFLGDGATAGAFSTMTDLLSSYTESGGLVADVQQRLDSQVSRLDDRILKFEERLAVREAALLEEFIAADLAISRLNTQQDALSSLLTQFSSL